MFAVVNFLEADATFTDGNGVVSFLAETFFLVGNT